jgi:hypothetical protein
MNRGNIPVLQSLFKRHRNIKNMTNELNQYPISQGRKNAITRRLKESMGRQRFGEEDSHTIARLLAESDDPIVILKRIRELPVSPEKQRKFMRHILYVFDGAVPPQEYMKFKNVYEHAMREGVNSPMLESLLSESGAFD